MDVKISSPLTTDRLSKPSIILWVLIVPQLVLLFLNLNSWTLVSGEMSIIQKKMAFAIFGYQIILLSAGIVLFVILKLLRREVSLILSTCLLLAHIAYLWLITAWLFKLLPESVTVWIFTPDEALYYQYIFMMPAIFYSGVRLACFSLPIKKAIDISMTIATLILVPLISYIFLIALGQVFYKLNIPTFVLATLFVGATVVTMLAFIRILAFIYNWLKNNKIGFIVFLVLVGLVGPIGGLILNRHIPFPCDFQSISVYVLAIINGFVLLINFRQGTRREIAIWFLRCLMYPFSLYFFLVFLPFLPLSVLAIIAAGTGFLVVTPVALFIVHTRKIIDEGKRVVGMIGLKRTAAIFTAAFLVMPTAIVIEAALDRHALMQAVDAVYNPDYTKPNTQIKPESVKHSLLKLRDMKEGIFLPFISSFYNKAVFNSMVLPDYKMNEMYLAFFGEEMSGSNSVSMFDIRGRGRSRNIPINMPERNVEISDITVDEQQEGAFVKASIQLTLHNSGANLSEFITEIHISPGVLISGYWLDVNGEKVKGHVFEQKAAMWVYHMIRDMTRRDPGLLFYKSDQLLKLSVFPFAIDENRTTNLELLYPSGMQPTVQVDGKTLELGLNFASKQIMLACKDDHTSVIVPPDVLKDLPSFTRQPYIHFIVDSSANAKSEFSGFGGKMVRVAQGFPKASGFKITLANYETEDLTGKPITPDEIEKLIAASMNKIEFRGAFCYERAIKQKLLQFNLTPADCNNVPPVPIYVVIKADSSMTALTGDMLPFAKFVPEMSNYYILTNDSEFTIKSFDGKEKTSLHIDMPESVALFKNGNSVSACATNANWGFADFCATLDNLSVYVPDEKTFKILSDSTIIDSNSIYANGLALWGKYRETVYYPSTTDEKLPNIVKLSKQCGVLTPLTSYIVLENSAQLEMLKRKEQQGLKANNALEFDEFMESPAPPVLLLIPIAFALLAIRKTNLKTH